MSANLGFALDAAWQVLLVALLLGAGLPTLFAFGVRALAWDGAGSDTGSAGTGRRTTPHPAGRAVAGLCFLVVLLVVALGITVVVSTGLGKEVSFGQGYPTLKDA